MEEGGEDQQGVGFEGPGRGEDPVSDEAGSLKVAIIGGTGAMGKALGGALARANQVMLGSRDPVRGKKVSVEVPGTSGGANLDASLWCEAAVIALPYYSLDSLRELEGALAGKLVMSMVNPIERGGGALRYPLKEGSAAERMAKILVGSRVSTAFNHVPATHFVSPAKETVDVLVAADDRATFKETAEVVESVQGIRAVYVGPLSEAQSVERVTVLLLNAGKMASGQRFSIRFVP